MARKTRITLLTIWSIIILVVFFTHHRSSVAAQRRVTTSGSVLKESNNLPTAHEIEKSPGFITGDKTEKVLNKEKLDGAKSDSKQKTADPKGNEQDVQKLLKEDSTVMKGMKITEADPAVSADRNALPAVSSAPIDKKQSRIAAFDPVQAYAEALDSAPIVIFSKTYCPYSAAAKQLFLEKYTITPKPLVIELDVHPNGKEFQDYIALQTDRKTVPNILINRVSRGGADNFVALDKAGSLLKQMEFWSYNTFTIKASSPN